MAEQDPSGYSRWSPDELLNGARQGFDLAHAYVRPDADFVRAEAADVFELAAGEKILAALALKGITFEQLEQLTSQEIQSLVLTLAPGAVSEIQERVASLDPHARNMIENTAYHTLRENGLTNND